MMGEIITHNIKVDKLPKWLEDLLAQSKLNQSRTRWKLMLYCQKRQLNSKYKQSKRGKMNSKKTIEPINLGLNKWLYMLEPISK